jgi:hypothetical protein
MNTESIKAALTDIRARLARLSAAYNVPVNDGAMNEYFTSSRFYKDCLSVTYVQVGTVTDERAREATLLAATCYDVYLAFASRHLYLKATGIPKKEFWATCDEFAKIASDAVGLSSDLLKELEPFKSGLPDISSMDLTRDWDIFGETRGARLEAALQTRLAS